MAIKNGFSLGICLICLLLCGDAWPAGLSVPDRADDERVAVFLREHSDKSSAYIQHWIGVDLRYEAKDQGLSGRFTRCLETAVLDKSTLVENSIVTVRNSPRWELKKIEITATNEHGKQRWRKKDLLWNESTQRAGGVVTLDGTVAQALLPGIQVGDRIRVVQEYEVKGLHGLPFSRLGDGRTPCLESVYELRVDADDEVIWQSLGATEAQERLRTTTPEQEGSGRYRWSLAADTDGSLPLCRDLYPHLDLIPHIAASADNPVPAMSLGADWAAVGDAYLERLGGLFNVSSDLAATAAKLTQDVDGVVAKTDRIYSWVQNRCHYLGLYEGQDGIIPASANDVFELGSGDCKGLSTLLIGMLRSVNIEAHPVLVLAGSGRKLAQDVPNLAQFNHYIAWVDTGDGGMFLDGTVDRYPAGAVPPQDAMSPVLLLKQGAGALVEIPSAAWHWGAARTAVTGSLAEDGYLQFVMKYTVTDGLARNWRNRLASLEDQELQESVEAVLLPRTFPAERQPVQIEGMSDWHAPLVITIEMKSKAPMPNANGVYYLPRVLFWDLLPDLPDLACSQRWDLRGRAGRSVSWEIALPAGFSMSEADTTTIAGPGLTWVSSSWQVGATLHRVKEVTYSQDFLNAADLDSLESILGKVKQLDAGYITVNAASVAD